MAQQPAPPESHDPRPPRFGPVSVVVVYLAVSAAYILSSDWILSLLVSDPVMAQRIQTFKGLSFVAATGVMLYFLIRAAVNRAKEFQSRLEASSSELGHITATVPGVVVQARLDSSGAWSFPYVSDPIEGMFGLTPDLVHRDPLAMFRVLDPRDTESVNRLIEKLQADPGPATLDFRITTTSGEHKWIRSQSVASRESDGATLFHAVLIDVTEARRRDSLREGQSAVLRMLITGASTEAVLESLALVAEAQVPNVHCTILLVDESGKRLTLGAAPSMDPQCAIALDGIPIECDSGACGAAAYHNRRVICEDTLTDPLCRGYVELIERFDLRACWSIPIARKDQPVLGTLAFYHAQPRRPTESDLKLAGEIADLAAVVIAQRQSETALRTSEARFRMLVSQSHVVIWQVEAPSDRFSYVSDFAQQLLKYPVEVWYQPHFWIDHVHPDDRARVLRYSRERTQAGQDHVFEYRMLAADGAEVWVRDFVSVVMEDGRPVRLLGALVDITAEKRAQMELRDSEERYRSIIEDQTELICRFLPDGAISFMNDACARFFEVSDRPRETHSVFRLLGASGQRALTATLRRLSVRQPVGQFELRVSPDGGPERVISWTCRALFDEGGKVRRYQAVGNDITELTAARDELMQINQRQTLLLDELDHRVKNSLAGLLSLVTLSEKEAAGVEELASSIRARVQTMAATHSLLSASHWRSVELRSLLHGLTPGESPGGVSFDGPTVHIPARQVTALGMIIQELMTNSVKYGGLASERGAVSVQWRTEEDADGRRLLHLHWSERGGAPISAPIKPRLGVSLINGFARSELGGEAQLSFPAQGANHTFRFRLDDHPRDEVDDSDGAGETDPAADPQDARA